MIQYVGCSLNFYDKNQLRNALFLIELVIFENFIYSFKIFQRIYWTGIKNDLNFPKFSK